MSPAADPDLKAQSSPRYQQLIVTLFGLYARQHEGALPVAGLVRLLGDLGVESASVRSAVARLKKRGVLESVKVAGAASYRLGTGLDEIFHEGDERIFSSRRASIYDTWLLAAFSVPEAQRNLRHKIRSALTRLGFGSVTPGLWIAPASLEGEARTQVARAGAVEYIEFFHADYANGDLPSAMGEKVASWWDLEALESMYVDFVANYRGVLARWEGVNPTTTEEEAEAFTDYVSVLTQWRRLPYLDPGLPVEYLPDDWHGIAAHDLFRSLHDRLSAPARRHAERALGGTRMQAR